jgi:hypothetical protein
MLLSSTCASVASASLAGPLAWGSPAPAVTPLPEPSVDPSLAAIACPSESLCVATDGAGDVATSTNPTDGTEAWQVAHVDSNTVCESKCPASLEAISCPSLALCVALDTAGYVFWSTNPAGGPAAWSNAKIGNTYGLTAVSCPSESLCVAVGSEGEAITSTDPSGGAGAWHAATIDPGPCPTFECQGTGTGKAPRVEAISCPSVSLCVATDWNGSVITSADPTGGAGAWNVAFIDHNRREGAIGLTAPAEIQSVACPSVSLCVASDYVGGVFTSRNPTGGSSAWTPTHALGVNSGELSDVTCPSTSRCIALDKGTTDVYLTDSPLAGTPWIQVASDNSVACRTYFSCAADLDGLSCPSDLLCIADDRGGNVIVGRAPSLTRVQVQALLRAALTPRGAPSRVGSLLSHRVFPLSFTAPSAGSVQIRWLLSPRETRAPRRSAGPLIAQGQGSFAAGATATIQLTLTNAGTGLARHRSRLRLYAEAVFTPANGRPIKATQTFTLAVQAKPGHVSSGEPTTRTNRRARKPRNWTATTPSPTT